VKDGLALLGIECRGRNQRAGVGAGLDYYTHTRFFRVIRHDDLGSRRGTVMEVQRDEKFFIYFLFI